MRTFEVDIPGVCILTFKCEEVVSEGEKVEYKGVEIVDKVWYPGGEETEKRNQRFERLCRHKQIIVLPHNGYVRIYFGFIMLITRYCIDEYPEEITPVTLQAPSMWNTKCPRCQAPAFMSYFTVECSGGCK